MKKVNILVIGLASMMLLGGCANNSNNTDTNASTSDASSANKNIENFIIGTTMNVQKVSPSDDAYSKITATLSSLPLISQKEDGTYSGLLFDYEIKGDNGFSDYYFTPKNNAIWEDGTSLSAEDIIFTIDYYKEYDSTFTLYKDLSSYTVEDNKAHIVFNSSTYTTINNFATFRILPKHIFEGKDYTTYLEHDATLSNGPYKFVSKNDDNNTLIFTRRDDYFLGAPNVKNIIVKQYTDSDVLNLALQSGEIDTIYNYGASLDSNFVSTLSSDKYKNKITLANYSTNAVPYILIFNSSSAHMELKYRQAISKAIDYESIKKVFGKDSSTSGRSGIINAGSTGYHETSLNSQDLTLASTLMQELGYTKQEKYWVKDGANATFKIATRTDKAQFQRCAEVVKNSLDAFGIETTIEEYASAPAFQKATGNKDLTHDSVITSLTAAGINMDAGMASRYFYGPLSHNVQAGNINDSEYVNLIDALKAATTEETYYDLCAKIQDYYANHYSASSLLCDYMTNAYNSKYYDLVIDPNYGVINALTWYSIKQL